ncbi:MAG: asparagine synthase (glutamine-hydrolyzing) [Verrucomicrobiales bacterium]|jgi:asparagine synthase (glutamine-hydrolysing)
MCGITAIIGDLARGAACERAISSIAHRGPDGSGILDRGWSQLAHRRLSIIDVEGGAQPLANEDHTCFVTFNGEIYNYVELREQLKAAGHTFRTASDTEVIVHAYEEWGDDCVSRLRGMFAFAVLDETRRSVFVARDRMGIKPVVYCCLPGSTIVASELTAIEAAVPEKLEIDSDAIHAFLRLGYIPAPLTIYKNVWKLPPASTIRFDRYGKPDRVRRYWDLTFEPVHGRTEENWIDEIDETIRESVRAHLKADVDFGAFLSGGLDSSLVVSYMSELLDRPVKTFSMGFDEVEFSESNFARTASSLCHTDHHESTLTQADLESSTDLVNCYGEPFGDNSALPTLKLCEVVSGSVKMALSGDGGDELFGGYDRYLRAAPLWMPSNRAPSMQAYQALRGAMRQILGREGYCPPSAYEHWHNNARMFTFDELQRLIGRQLSYDPAGASFDNRTLNISDWHYLSQLQYYDIHSYLPGDILTKVDIASMRHGLEVRVPLLDHKVAELAATIPPELLVTQTASGFSGKSILKKLAERRFPREFVHRKKQGFGFPIASWINQIPPGKLNDQLLGYDSLITRHVDEAAVRDLLSNISSPMRSRKIWLLLILQRWLVRRSSSSLCLPS